jgi:hypothetical protein
VVVRDIGKGGARCRGRSPRRHAQRAIETDHLAVQDQVLDDRGRQVRALLRPAQALRDRDAGGQ